MLNRRPLAQSEPLADPAEELLRAIGRQLQENRLQRGEDLHEVADFLRIKPSYLLGLEQGDLSAMPGRPYALGFLRSYADYLGLDGEAAVAQIKAAVDGLPGNPELHYRTPLPENRRPQGAILALSLVLAVGVYGAWYLLDDRATGFVETVAEVPLQLRDMVMRAWPDAGGDPLDLLDDGAAPPAELAELDPAIDAEMPPARAEGPLDGSPEGAPESPVATAIQPPPGGAAGPAPIGPTEVGPAASVAEAPALNDLALEASPEPDRPLVRALASGDGDTGAAAAGTPPAGGASPAAEMLAALAGSDSRDPGEGQVYGGGEGVRVVLRARESSWIQVRSDSRDYVRTQTLEPGDSFLVPDRADLALWTGNAGGLEVLVDGEPIGPIGQHGAVVRDVSLDPEQLLVRGRNLP
jgi:cytoskeleton protein RodZ